MHSPAANLNVAPQPRAAPAAAVTVSSSDVSAPAQQPDAPPSASAKAELDDDDAGSEELPSADAGVSRMEPDAGGVSVDAGETTTLDAATDAADRSDAPPTVEACARDPLRERADRYLEALASGDLSGMAVHGRVRYTENGQEQLLGLGLWLNRPRTEFARHVIDTAACSSATEAVLRDATGLVVLGVRLRYLEEQLLEVEAHVVPRIDGYYAPNEIIPRGSDPWVEPIPVAQRSSAQALSRVAMRYFDATADVSLLPPSAQGCERRQNGALMTSQGSCRVAPGSQRFEQTRVAAVDETTGIVVVMTKYDDFIGMYLFKVQADTVMDIEVVGGASSASTGW
jgi:hypothetical protein